MVSIIIPVRTITRYLRESVRYIEALAYNDYEVLIVTDRPEVIPGLSDRFIFISSGRPNPAEKRNLAARIARGEVLAFLDDDAFPLPDWLDKAMRSFAEPSVVALGGPAMTPENEMFLEAVSGEVLASNLISFNTSIRLTPGTKTFVDDWPSVNLFVRKSAFDKVGGFDRRYWPGEDTKLCLDLINTFGRKILYDPGVVVYHHRRPVFLSHLKQVSRYGRHRGRFAVIFPQNSRKLMYFIPSLFVAGLLAGPVTLSFSHYLFSLYLLVVDLYILLVAVESASVSIRRRNLLFAPYFFLSAIATHLTYGIFFLYGIVKNTKFAPRSIDKEGGGYIGG